MGSADWTFLTGILGAGDVARGVTSGPTKPNGGGTFLYGMNSLTNTPGGVGLYCTPQPPNTNFNPLVKGGDIRAALSRGVGGGVVDFSAFLFLLLGGTAITDKAYMLGLSDGDPCHIELRKGALSGGLPDEAPDPTGPHKIIRRSTTTIAVGSWVHLRLEAVVNTDGDVVLNCYMNDLGSNPVTAPVWVAIPGMASFTDDALGIATGELPYTGGRMGFGGTFADVTRRAYFDQIEALKQV
jgi:hypothetical protein